MSPEPPPPPASPNSKVILVVDDDHSLRGVVKMLLTMEGFQVVTAVNGNDALVQLESNAPDLIITDLMMPGQGGYEFLRQLPGAGAGSLPVIILSGSGLDESTIAQIRHEANAADFFKKPVDQRKFVGAVHRLLNTRK